jgi:DNA-binding transcriptional MerR regulator
LARNHIIVEERLLIGEVCRRLDCTPRTVRYYEEKGLVVPASVIEGRHKLYGPDTLSNIRMAQLMKRLGYSLEKIQNLMNLTKSSKTKNRVLSDKLRGVLRDTVSSLDSEVELLAASRRKMAGLLEKTEKCEKCIQEECAGCGNLTILRTLWLPDS